MSNIIDLLQGSPEWKEFRHDKIGGSDAAAVVGECPWTTPLQLFERKRNKLDVIETEAMAWGKKLEPEAREMFEKITGILVQPKVMVHKKYGFIMASYDGVGIYDKIFVEIKCPFMPGSHFESKIHGVPNHYQIQMQHECAVDDFEKGYYFSYYRTKHSEYGSGDWYLTTVDRNDDYIENMIRAEIQFAENLKAGIPPEPRDRDREMKCDVIWNEAAQDYLRYKEYREHFTRKEEAAKELLINMGEGRNCQGGGINLTRIVRQGYVDYSQIPELSNIDLDKYRKPPIESWRISCS